MALRILCLHGQGASAKIMESQTSNVRALLPATWEYDYPEAPHDSEPAAELKDVYPGPNSCFFDRYSPEKMQEAVEYVNEIVEEDGPYDGVIGFSQGASVAAAYIAQCLKERNTQPFQFAVFICAALVPPSTATTKELARTIGSLGSIDIPTTHIIGQKDHCYNQSSQLMLSCDSALAHKVLHSGGHDVPRDDVNCHNIAAGIERCARLAFSRGF